MKIENLNIFRIFDKIFFDGLLTTSVRLVKDEYARGGEWRIEKRFFCDGLSSLMTVGRYTNLQDAQSSYDKLCIEHQAATAKTKVLAQI